LKKAQVQQADAQQLADAQHRLDEAQRQVDSHGD